MENMYIEVRTKIGDQFIFRVVELEGLLPCETAADVLAEVATLIASHKPLTCDAGMSTFIEKDQVSTMIAWDQALHPRTGMEEYESNQAADSSQPFSSPELEHAYSEAGNRQRYTVYNLDLDMEILDNKVRVSVVHATDTKLLTESVVLYSIDSAPPEDSFSTSYLGGIMKDVIRTLVPGGEHRVIPCLPHEGEHMDKAQATERALALLEESAKKYQQGARIESSRKTAKAYEQD